MQFRVTRIAFIGFTILVPLIGTVVWAYSSSEPNAASSRFAPAANLRITARETAESAAALLDPAHPAWSQATATAILLNRTPRIYSTEPIQSRSIPGCEARLLRAKDKQVLRLAWDDATKNAPEAPPARSGGGGDPKQLYKRPTGETAAFADAAAVMVPENWQGPAFPSLLMGDKQSPAKLYYWNASRGAEVMTASGRATPQPTGQKLTHRAGHEPNRWTLVLELADIPAGYPIAFALWDGEFGDRDGLKFFSVWYVVTQEVKESR